MRSIESKLLMNRCSVCNGLQGKYITHKDGSKEWQPCKHCNGKGTKKTL